jgi:hypothetical protein
MDCLDVQQRASAATPDDTTRAMRVIDDRCSQLRDFIHEQLEDVWNALIRFVLDAKTLTINQSLPGRS